MSEGPGVLEQGEIDALLNGVGSGAVATEESDPPPSGVEAYDFSKQVHTIAGRMPALDLIYDRFARRLKTALYNLLRRSVEVTLAPSRSARFQDYSQALAAPVHLNLIKLAPLRGTALIVFDASLVCTLVDSFFGGSGRSCKIEGREFTATEARVVALVLRQVLAELREAWSPAVTLQPTHQSSETNPLFACISAPADEVVVTTLQLAMDGGAGALQIVVPYAMIDPIRGQLEASFRAVPVERDARWSQRLRSEVERVEIELVPQLGTATLTVEQMINIRPGDVIPCDFEGQVTLTSAGLPLVRGALCNSRGRHALQVSERITVHGDDPPA